jgi:hypothetical protein
MLLNHLWRPRIILINNETENWLFVFHSMIVLRFCN